MFLKTEPPCLTRPAEIAFVVDHSGSMLGVWPDVKTWLKKAIDGYKIDGITRKGGLVVWAGDIKKDQTITFFENKNAADLKAAIDGLPSPTGGTKGGKALTFTYENLFKTGSDPSALRKIVFLTDGDSTDSMKGPAEQVYIKIAVP